tara:strand:+ start:8842 stop:9192 length:351 start_codon:yes stop_codon:yes gene_type:complete
MKASDLRIGNWVNLNNKDVQVKCRDITVLEYWEKKPNEKSTEYFKPIPLTEEWLLKFGFNVKMGSVSHNHSYIKDRIIIKNLLRGGFYYDETNIKHVHQLQNLYHALTQKELSYEL